MELEEMKSLWQKYEKAIDENKILNEKMIKYMMKEKSAGQLAKILNTEYFGLVFCLLLLMAFLTMTGKAMASVTAMAAFIVLMLAISVTIVWSAYKIELLRSIDMAEGSIADVSLKMERFRLYISKERLWGTFLLPVLLVCTYVFIDGLDSTQLLEKIPGLIIGSIVGTAVAYLLYKSIYFDRINVIRKNIEKIRAFKGEA